MTQRKRVLWLTKGLGRGGTERLLAGTAKLLDRSRWDIEVAYILPAKDAFVPELERLRVPIYCLEHPRARNLGWLLNLRRLLGRGHYDIVHTHMPYPAVAARLLLRSAPPYLVHTEHNLWPRYRALTYWGNALTYRRNAAVIAVSQGVADSIRAEHVPGRAPLPPVEVVIHGVEQGFFEVRPGARATARARLSLDPGAPVVGSVGNFTAKKDHHTMIEAIARLHGRRPTLKLLLIGSGPLEDALRSQTHRLGLDGVVRFLGSRDDVADLLPALDLFLLASRHEGLSIALLEAMAAGVPAVATRVGGIPEVLEEGRQGLLVPPGDPDAFASAVGHLLDDDARRTAMAKAGIARAHDFDLASAVHQMENIYEKVLAR